VAAVALRQGRELARHASQTLISDSRPDHVQWAELSLLSLPDLTFLRRFRHVPDEYLFVRAARRALWAAHARRPIDFVICHSHAVAALTAAPFRGRTGVRFGLVVHGDIFDRPRGTYDARQTAFYRHVTPRAYRSADVIFALSPHMGWLAVRGGAPPAAVVVVPNGIDPADIGLQDAVARRRRADGLRLLYVGRLAVEKGVDVLIAACGLLPASLPFELDIVGTGPCEESLRRSIQGLGLGGRVHMLGARPRHELGPVYAAHDIACVPSLSEPLGGVVLEALASGIPVIATNVGGNPFMVRDSVNGLLVAPADPRALADAIALLARNERLWEALAEQAAPSVRTRFSWPAIGDQIVGVIRGCLAADQAARARAPR